MKEILLKAEETNGLNSEEIIRLLVSKDELTNNELYSLADKIRTRSVGNEIYLRALIEFSNICQRNCLYCGLRLNNKKLKRYSLSEDEILNCVENATNLGFKTIVLQSGESLTYSQKRLVNLIKEIKKYDVALTLSLGEKAYDEYKAYKDAGADRYLLRIETTDKNLYKQMHPNSSFENRVECLNNLKKLNYEVGSGCLVGLPNQTVESLAEDILFFKKINADMIGIGPFISHPHTPLSTSQNGNFSLAVKVMSITRILMPEINIPATTAMESLVQTGQKIALQCGANVVMINWTDDSVKKQYDIYPNKISTAPSKIKEKLSLDNRTIEMNRGNSLKWEKENQNKD